MKKKVILDDVAKRAGVSRTTASYILGKTRGGFATETVERVHAAARELGFQPNLMARGLASGRTRIIAVLTLENMESAQQLFKYQTEIGIGIESRNHRIDVLKVIFSPDEELESSRINDLLGSGLIEGVILEMPGSLHPVIQWLQNAGAKFVILGLTYWSCSYSIDIDNVSVGRISAQHLIDLGHRHLGYVTTFKGQVFADDRLSGFLLTCREAGLDTESVPVMRAEDSMAGGYNAMQEMLKTLPRVTGVCAVDDIMANGAVAAIKEAGLDVPGDISVMGCNNDFSSVFGQEYLTTVDLNFVEVGVMAARKLITLIENKPAQLRELNPKITLIPRKSSAPPRTSE